MGLHPRARASRARGAPLQKRHNKLTGWRVEIIFQWQVLTCQLKLQEGGSAASEAYLQAPPPFSLPRLPLGLLLGLLLFPPMRILVPGYKLYISKYKLMYAYRLYLCTWGYQYSMFPLHKSLQPRLQVCTQGYKSIELSFRACSYYRF